MVRPCNEAKDKEVQRKIAAKLGPKLIKDHGKKKHYTKKEIDQSYNGLDIPFDFNCWGYSMFMEHGSFDSAHAEMGETCDFISMKTEMLNLVPKKAESSWFDFDWDLSELDLSRMINLDILDVFDV